MVFHSLVIVQLPMCHLLTDCWPFWNTSKCILSLTEIMSGDLLEDLMSSEGKFDYRHSDWDNNYNRIVEKKYELIVCNLCNKDALYYISVHGLIVLLIWSVSLSVSPPVFSPLLRLSPPPSDHDYIYNLDETEGLCDLFDVPILNLWPQKLLSEWKHISLP